jgi:hypothetical protein
MSSACSKHGLGSGRSPANQIVSVPLAHALATKQMMFWALARVSFRAAKIVSCNKNIFFHGLRWKLPQLFYFFFLVKGLAKLKFRFLLKSKKSRPHLDVERGWSGAERTSTSPLTEK